VKLLCDPNGSFQSNGTGACTWRRPRVVALAGWRSCLAAREVNDLYMITRRSNSIYGEKEMWDALRCFVFNIHRHGPRAASTLPRNRGATSGKGEVKLNDMPAVWTAPIYCVHITYLRTRLTRSLLKPQNRTYQSPTANPRSSIITAASRPSLTMSPASTNTPSPALILTYASTSLPPQSPVSKPSYYHSHSSAQPDSSDSP